MRDDYFAVIMAGGGGTRLWPLSRQSKPKQLLTLYGGKTFFQLAVDRLSPIFSPDHILVVTVASQVDALRNQVNLIPFENYLIEPLPRGTASVVGYAAEILQKMHPNATMAVLTSDHIIENETLFLQLLDNAYEVAERGFLVTLGIQPTFPSTGYGYIHKGERLAYFSFDSYTVQSFVEKPDLAHAEQYLASDACYWNSGMFVWKTDIILNEFNRQMPILHASLELLGQRYGKEDYENLLSETWQKIAPQTIDYGIMEHAQNVAVLPAENLGWSDVGSWDSLFEIIHPDQNGNVNLADLAIIMESDNCLIKTDDSQKIIVLAGLEDTIIIDTKDALLVCRKGQSQKVRELVNELKQKKLDRFL
jgi:mannose-1-phosphate guanylyltransferase